MHVLVRATKSIGRNKAKTLIMFLTMTVLGIFVTGSIVIKDASENVRDRFMKKAGASLNITYKLEDDLTDYRSWSMEHKNQEETFDFYYSTIIELTENEYVRDCSYSLYMFNYTDQLCNADTYYSGMFSAENYLVNKVLLYGCDRTAFTDINTYDINLKEGRSFSKKEINDGSKVCIINEKLKRYDEEGNEQDIKIGDQIPYQIIVFDSSSGSLVPVKEKILEIKEEYLTVIGKFHVNEEGNGEMSRTNRIYVPNKLVEETFRTYKEMEGRYSIYKGDSYRTIGSYCMGMTDVLIQTDTYINAWYLSEEINDKLMILNQTPSNLNSDGEPINIYYKLIRSNDAYMNVSWVLKSLDNFSDIILYVAVGAFVVVLSLIMALFLKSRKTEIGILMSLGEKKSRIILQIVLEVFIVGVLSSALSTYIGYALSKPVSQSMIETSMVAESETGTTDSEGNIINKIAGIDEEDIVEMFEIKITSEEIIKVVLTELGVILASSAVTVFYITRFRPKKVLLG